MSERPSREEDLARVQVELATAAADATPLADLGPTVRDLTRVQPLLEQLLHVVADLLGTDMAAVWVTDPFVDELYAAAWTGLPDDYIGSLRVPFGSGSAGRAVTTGAPVMLTDIGTEPSYAPFSEQAQAHGITSVLSMPMLTLTGAPMGALSAYYRVTTDPGPRERRLVEAYARQAAEIVERARMHGEARQLADLERRRAAQLRGLADAALALTAADTVEVILQVVTDAARDVIGAREVVATRREAAQELAAAPRTVTAPLIGRSGATLGHLQLSQKADGQEFTAEDQLILVQLAQMASAAIDALEALERERTARREAEAAARAQATLSEASAQFAEVLEPAEVTRLLTALSVPDLASLAVVYRVMDAGPPELADIRTEDASLRNRLIDYLERFPPSIDQPHGIGHVLVTGEPELLPEVTDDILAAVTADAAEAALLRTVVLRSGLCVPLIARGRLLGVLALSRDDAYTDREVAYALDLARRGALAMDNATRYAFERDLAGALQRSLLPRSTPASALLTIASRYLAGARGTQVGGDWYDVIDVGGGRLMFVVGDVMGRGVRAAAVMGQLRATVRAYAVEGHGPAELLTRLDLVVQSLDEVHFTTCAVGLLDPTARDLCVALAGHLPPLVVRPDGTADYLEADPGLPLGVGGAEFVEQHVDLTAGSTVLLYTDGLVEGRELSVEEGMRLLREEARKPIRSAEELCDRVLHALGHDGDHDDDTALLVLLLDDGSGQDGREPLVLELSASPESAATAREALAVLLGPDAGEPGQTAALLLTELVSNAVRFAGGDLLVRAGVHSDLLLVEVCDTSERMPTSLAAPNPDAESGRGMLLVSELADRWGAEPLPTGKRVWFELSL
ncbi:MAG: protein serine/threonine phosphatase with GAF(s) sensor(s) [Frankiales bacterium]|nr:protein serine/threonine phosphatase with GAF(s) sensor(s) [Frankiales bacterium]